MEKMKEFFRNISKTGWIIISLVIVVILLIIIGVVMASRGVDLWPFNNNVTERLAEESGEQEEFLQNFDRTLESANDAVLSVEDVLSGKYDNSFESATVYVQNTTEVQVAVVIDEEEYEIDTVDASTCGNLVFVSTRVPNKPGIINETLKAMFTDSISTDFLPGNVLANSNPSLVFDNAVLEEGVAKVYLRGEFGNKEGSECVQSLTVSQIEETVKQFDTVVSVEIYQNLQKIN